MSGKGTSPTSSASSANRAAEEESSHVHFKVEDVSTHESQIVVEEKEQGIMEVHLGFLKIFHIYEVTFCLPHKLGKDVRFDPLESVLVKVKEITPTEEGHKLVVEFNAQKEKVMKEQITLRSTASDDVISLIFLARVLGKHKGTPSLRDGIHFLRKEGDDDEDSEWPGF